MPAIITREVKQCLYRIGYGGAEYLVLVPGRQVPYLYNVFLSTL